MEVVKNKGQNAVLSGKNPEVTNWTKLKNPMGQVQDGVYTTNIILNLRLQTFYILLLYTTLHPTSWSFKVNIANLECQFGWLKILKSQKSSQDSIKCMSNSFVSSIKWAYSGQVRTNLQNTTERRPRNDTTSLRPKRWTKQAGWISNMIPIFHWRFLESNDIKRILNNNLGWQHQFHHSWEIKQTSPQNSSIHQLSPNLQISRPLNQKILAASHNHCSSYLQPEWIVTSGRSLPCLWVHAIARSFQVGPRSVSM